jgi:hypothetical protein
MKGKVYKCTGVPCKPEKKCSVTIKSIEEEIVTRTFLLQSREGVALPLSNAIKDSVVIMIVNLLCARFKLKSSKSSTTIII